LERNSDLGFHGADVIHEVLKGRKVAPLPSVRTIHRILERRGALDGQRSRPRTASNFASGPSAESGQEPE
jgi:hypothetical protein